MSRINCRNTEIDENAEKHLACFGRGSFGTIAMESNVVVVIAVTIVFNWSYKEMCGE